MRSLVKVLLVFGILAIWTFLPVAAYGNQINGQINHRDAFHQGVERFNHGNYVEAIASFTTVINAKPINADASVASAYSNRCLAHIQIGNYAAAIDDCAAAIAIDPELTPHNAEVFLNKGLANYRMGNYQAAIADYDRVLAIQPDDLRAYYNRGLAYFETKNLKIAISDYDRAIDLVMHQNPPLDYAVLADIYNDLGLTYLTSNNYVAAVANFDRAIAINAHASRAYYNRGCAYQQQRLYAQAVQDFSRYLELDPQSPDALFTRGIAQYHLGYRDLAIADLQRALDSFRDRGSESAYREAFNLLQEIQQLAAAEYA